jgi:hypothetical protein
MTSTMQLMQRLGSVGALAAFAIALNGCGRVDTAQTGSVAQAAAPTAAVVQDYPELPTVQVVPQPTPVPLPTLPPSNSGSIAIPAAPAMAPAVSGDTVQFEVDYSSSTDVSMWNFTQVFEDPVSPPAWTIDEGALLAPINDNTLIPFNDTIAYSGPAQSANYSFETTAIARYSSVLGAVVGYSDQKNFVALLLTAADGAPNSQPGLQLVQYIDGTPKTLAYDKNITLQSGSWYALRVDVNGNQIKASVNDKQVFDVTASGELGRHVGLYAYFQGSTYFSTARLSVR